MKRSKTSKTKTENKKDLRGKKSENKNRPAFTPFIISVLMFAVCVFLMPDKVDLFFFGLNEFSFYVINVLLSLIVLYSLSGKKYSKEVVKYTFLVLLIVMFGLDFFKAPEKISAETIDLYRQITSLRLFLLIPSAVTGVIAVFQNKEKLRVVVNGLFTAEKAKFRLFSKKELPYTITLFVIVLISAITLFYRLDNFDLYSDEAQVTQGAAGYYHTGKYEFWDFVKDKSTGIKYDRAKPHLFTVAQSYKLFGVNTWSSRFPSAVFGLIMTVLGYFVARYFVKDKKAAVFISFSFVFYFEFLLLQRWARMYAMLFPVFLLLFYTAYRFFTEPLPEKYKKIKENSFFGSYLDFNYVLLPALLILLVFALSLHINSAIITAIFFIFIILSAILFKEKKYIIPIIAGLLIVVYQIYFPSMFSYRPLTFFKADNAAIYSGFFLAYPFGVFSSLVVLVAGGGVLILSENKKLVKRYLSLYISIIFSWIFFSYIVNFAVSFRYMSFLAPLAIFTVAGMLFLIIKTLYGKIIRIIIVGLITANILTQFLLKYDDLYVRNFTSPAKPSVAWRKIIDNYQKGEVVFRHWGPMMYFDDLDSTATVRTIGSGKKRKMLLNALLDSLKNYKSGWLTWNTHNSHVLDPAIPDYCNLYFDKVSGYGIDKLGVEIFHYTDSMVVDTNSFKLERYMPFANLNLANDFSISFLIIADKNAGKPFFFNKEKEEPVEFVLYPDKENTLAVHLPENVILNSSADLSGNWHLLTFTKNKQEASLFVDGKLTDKKTLNNNFFEILKFKINPFFKGQINDIRIYDIALNQAQINAVISNSGKSNSEVLEAEGKKFKTLFHWQRK